MVLPLSDHHRLSNIQVSSEAEVALSLFNKTLFYVGMVLDLQNVAKRGQRASHSLHPVLRRAASHTAAPPPKPAG